VINTTLYATCETPNGKTNTADPRRRFIRKAQHSLTGAHVVSTLSVRIETAVIVFKYEFE